MKDPIIDVDIYKHDSPRDSTHKATLRLCTAKAKTICFKISGMNVDKLNISFTLESDDLYKLLEMLDYVGVSK